MKGVDSERRIYAALIVLIVITAIFIIDFTATARAQNQGLRSYPYPSYLHSYLGLSIFGNPLYRGLNGGFFSTPSSIAQNFQNTPWTLSAVPGLSSLSWTSSKVSSEFAFMSTAVTSQKESFARSTDMGAPTSPDPRMMTFVFFLILCSLIKKRYFASSEKTQC